MVYDTFFCPLKLTIFDMVPIFAGVASASTEKDTSLITTNKYMKIKCTRLVLNFVNVPKIDCSRHEIRLIISPILLQEIFKRNRFPIQYKCRVFDELGAILSNISTTLGGYSRFHKLHLLIHWMRRRETYLLTRQRT